MSLLSTPFDPAHDTALVTGAGNGIGGAIAQALVGADAFPEVCHVGLESERRGDRDALGDDRFERVVVHAGRVEDDPGRVARGRVPGEGGVAQHAT